MRPASAAPTAPAPGSPAAQAGTRLRLLRRARASGSTSRRCSPASRELAIPPAWTRRLDLPVPERPPAGHGIDAAGRKQYRYHDAWRARRDQEKFDDMVRFARALPKLRAPRRRRPRRLRGARRARCVLACAVRLLDRGFFRIGSEEYAVQNESYGLATMRKEHVRIERGRGDGLRLPGQERPAARAGHRRPRGAARRGRARGAAAAAPELLAYKERGRWRDVRSEDINLYLKEATGDDFSAKDFRTWNATVLAAVALGVSGEVARHARPAASAAINARGRRGRALPGQHARGLPRLLHRPARVRRLPGGPDHPAGAGAGRRAAGAG